MTAKKLLQKIALFVLLFLPMLLPLVVDNSYYINGLFNQILISVILILSLDILMGYVGDVSLGHAGLFALGAYTVAILTASPEMNSSADASLQFLPQIGFFPALIVAMVVTGFVGCALAYPSLRLSGDYLAVSTLVFGLVVHLLVVESESLTNGTRGIHLPPLKMNDFSFEENNYFWLLYPILIALFWMIRNLMRSHWGRSLGALRSSFVAAESLGISRTKFKTKAFILSAAIAGLAGGLFSQLNNYVGPNSFSLDYSILLVIALIFGGLRSLLGNILGIGFFILMPELLVDLKDYQHIVFGILLLVTMFFLPSGLAGGCKQLFIKLRQSPLGKKIYTKMSFLAGASSFTSQVTRPSEWPSLVREHCQVHHNGSDEALDVFELDKNFGGVSAVADLNCKIQRGQVHGIMGPNGSGKSTFINLLSGIYPASKGRIRFFGRDISSLKAHERVVFGISRTFQNLQIFDDFTVLENVKAGLYKSYHTRVWQLVFRTLSVRREEERADALAMALLDFVGLSGYAMGLAGSLSYGQRRRLEIARCLATRPSLLLLDEPAAGFGQTEIAELNTMITKLKALGITILVVEHHMDVVMKICDEVTVLNFGRMIAQGTPEKVKTDPLVVSAYLGQEASRG